MKNILITGANRGIGLELVRQYSERGERIFAACRTPESAVPLQQMAGKSDGRITVVALDVADAASIAAAFATIVAQTDRLNLLIHNAGVANSGRDGASSKWEHLNFDFDEILAVLRTNAVSTMVITQRFYPFLKAGGAGTIVAGVSSGMGSIAGVRADAKLNLAYSGSKTLMNHFLHHFAAIGAADGILSVALSPGWVKTDMGGANADLSPEESVTGILGVLDRLTTEQSGAFLDYRGNTVPW